MTIVDRYVQHLVPVIIDEDGEIMMKQIDDMACPNCGDIWDVTEADFCPQCRAEYEDTV